MKQKYNYFDVAILEAGHDKALATLELNIQLFEPEAKLVVAGASSSPMAITTRNQYGYYMSWFIKLGLTNSLDKKESIMIGMLAEALIRAGAKKASIDDAFTAMGVRL